MFKIFDYFTGKDYTFKVQEKDLMNTLKMLVISSTNTFNWFNSGNKSAKVSNNGIEVVNDKECWMWDIEKQLTNKGWNLLIQQCREKKYKLIIEKEPNVIYVTRD